MLGFIRERKVRRGLLKGDPQSLEMLFETYADKLFLYAMSLLKIQEEAEEAVQNLFLKLVKNPELTINVKNLKTYFFSAIKNESISIINKRKNNLSLDENKSEGLFLPASGNNCEEILLRDALEILPAEQKEVLILKIYDNLSFKEIGKVLDIPLNTAASRYRYAIDSLRKKLEGGT